MMVLASTAGHAAGAGHRGRLRRRRARPAVPVHHRRGADGGDRGALVSCFFETIHGCSIVEIESMGLLPGEFL